MKKLHIDYSNPSPDDICPLEIAACLARIRRWQGMGMSVAQHCLEVAADLCLSSREVRLWALLHDAHEAYLGDVAGPLEHGDSMLAEARERFDRAICTSAGIAMPSRDTLYLVREADHCAREDEVSYLRDDSVHNPWRYESSWLKAVYSHLPESSPWRDTIMPPLEVL